MTDEAISGGTTAFRLDDLTVDPDVGVIRGPAGREAVDPKVMAVLVELARARGRVVSRDELLERIWKTDCVSDDVVSRCIYCLRGHFETAGGDSSWRDRIQTLPRRGYRLEAPVVSAEGPTGAGGDESHRRRPGSRRGRLVFSLVFSGALVLFALLATLAAYWLHVQSGLETTSTHAPGPPSIAVLPFSNLGMDRQDEYLGHGIAAAVTTLLARSRPERVMAHSSSFALAAGNPEPAEAAARLGVSHVVEGGVRRSGERIAISARIVDAATGKTAWADRWTAPLSRLPRVEERIASAIADELGLRPPAPASSRPGIAEAGDAYIDVLHARHLMHRRDPGDLDEAIRRFERAVQSTPALADAWAGLSTAAWLRAEGIPHRPDDGGERDALLATAQHAGERAVALDPDHAEALLRLSRIALGAGDAELANALYDRARRAAPHDPTGLAMDAGVASRRGDLDGAIALLERALARDPLAAAWRGNLAWYLFRAGRLERAREEAKRVIGLSNGSLTDQMRTLLAEIAIAQGRLERARALAEEIGTPLARAYVDALLHSAAGELEAVIAALARLEAIETPLARIRLAEARAFHGEPEAALQIVRELVGSFEEAGTAGQRAFVRASIDGSHHLAPLVDHPDWPASTLQRFP